MDLDDVKSGSNKERAPGMGDIASVYKFPEKKWVSLRLIPGIQPEAGYWVKTKKKDGKFTKFYTACPSFDPATQERDSTKVDPWRDLQLKEAEAIRSGDKSKDEAIVQYANHFWMQAIIRSEQKKQPSKLPKPTKDERANGFKDKESDSWTPVMVVKIGRSLANKLKELKGLNTVESKKTGAVKSYSVNDAKFGRDIRVYYDSSKAPADQYQVQIGDTRTPLTEDEEAYLKWDMSGIVVEFDPAEVKRDFDSWASRNGVKKSKGDDDEDDAPKKGKKKVVEEDDDFDDEEDEAPKKSKKSKKVEEEDEDLEDEDDLDDEDEDEPPKKSKKGKKAVEEEDDEEDDDLDDNEDEEEDDLDEDDEEEDEPPKKSKKAKKSKPDEDDFDDEEEEEAPKKSKKGKKVEEDEDDLDDDDLDDDEEEDEPPKKSKKAKKSDDDEDEAPKKSKKGKKSKSDEDDFDDWN